MRPLTLLFAATLVLAAGFCCGAPPKPKPHPPLPKTPRRAIPRKPLAATPPRNGPGDIIPQCYMVYGLKSGPGGMVCTDRGGEALPFAFHPQVLVAPSYGVALQPASTAPSTITVTP